MPRLLIAAALAAATLASPALAEGDARAFAKCRACHSVTAPDGTVIYRGGRTGPDLYGVIGRQAGSLDGYRYSPSLAAAGEAGLVWDEQTLTAFLADPTAFLRAHLEDGRARSNMSFKLASGAPDILAYLQSVTDEAS